MNITGNTKGGKTDESAKADKNSNNGTRPLNRIKDEIEEGKIKPVKEKNPAKQREQSEQPVHPIKQAPKE